MEHVVTQTTWRGHSAARCTCGARWAPIGYDGGPGNRNEGGMIRHLRLTGGRFSKSNN